MKAAALVGDGLGEQKTRPGAGPAESVSELLQALKKEQIKVRVNKEAKVKTSLFAHGALRSSFSCSPGSRRIQPRWHAVGPPPPAGFGRQAGFDTRGTEEIRHCITRASVRDERVLAHLGESGPLHLRVGSHGAHCVAASVQVKRPAATNVDKENVDPTVRHMAAAIVEGLGHSSKEESRRLDTMRSVWPLRCSISLVHLSSH